jgi:predicted transposase/invertase (TIGR01784 family)
MKTEVKEKIVLGNFEEEYLKELDKKYQMIPLYYDKMFKSVMAKNIDVFKRFLIMTLNIDTDINSSKLNFMDKEFPKEIWSEKGKIIDINVRINDKYIIDVELNSSNFDDVKFRNSGYLDKLTTTLLETGEDYNELRNRDIYQLNLNLLDNYKNMGENIIVSYDLTTQTIYIDNKKIYLKHLEYYRSLYYNNYRNLTFDEMILVSITAKSFTELNEILSKVLNVKEKNRFLESVINMSLDEFCLHAWEKEKLDAMVDDIRQENAFNDGKKEGIEEGKKEGIEQGKKEGIEQGIRNTITSMLKNKLDYETISKVTDKTVDEIKEIEKNIKE